MTNHQELRAKQATGPRSVPKNVAEKSVKVQKLHAYFSV